MNKSIEAATEHMGSSVSLMESMEQEREKTGTGKLFQRAGKNQWYLPLCTLILAASFILPGLTKGEFQLNIDEAFHATTGLFFADLVRDLPVRHPIDYAYQYYAQYPALGIVHWPPLFYLAEGLSFVAGGSSVSTARLTTFVFTMFGLYFWFRLVRDLEGEWTAAACTIVLSAVPAFLLYEKAVMLEIPSLAFCMAATYYWMRYLVEEDLGSAVRFGVCAGFALLTKQQTIYLAPVCLIALLAARKWRLLLRRNTIAALVLTVTMATPFYAICFGVDAKSVVANLLQGVEHVTHPLTYYPVAVSSMLGTVLLSFAIVGLATWYWWRKPQASPLMIAWIGGWYITFTALSTKTPRYMLYWLPPFIYFAISPLFAKRLPRQLRPVALTVAVGLVAVSCWTGWNYKRPYVSGYDAIARQIVKEPHGSVVLFDGDLAGNFIFFMRANDPSRRFVVLRKALYVTEVMAQFGNEDLVQSESELSELLKKYGIKYVVVEKGIPLQFKSQAILREFLQRSDRFRVVQDVRIDSNIPEWNRRNLMLYENLDAGPPSEQLLRLKMLSMSHDIVEPLNTYLKR